MGIKRDFLKRKKSDRSGSGGQRSIQLSYPPTRDEGLLYSTDAFHSKVFKREVKG